MSKHSEHFSVDVEALGELVQAQSEGTAEVDALGGVSGVAHSLKTDIISGRTDNSSLEASRKEAFGTNTLPPPAEVTFMELVAEALADKMMLLLIASAIVSLVLGLTVPDEHGNIDYAHGWIEGTAILVSVAIVTLVTSINNYQKELKFKELNAARKPAEFYISRSGSKKEIPEKEILVGDVLHLVGGDVVPVDGLLIKGVGLNTDESETTGENEPLAKSVDGDILFRSGSYVLEGEGCILVTAIGVNSLSGVITMKCREDKSDTPLQEKLTQLADNIGYLGMGAASLMLVILSAKELYKVYVTEEQDALHFKKFLDMLTTSVTIVVVAVPEGLPLSVTIALAYSMKQMMRENNFVRHLAACETMGGATTIATDKTGTLTKNEMTVMRGWICGQSFALTGNDAKDADLLRKGILSGPKPILDMINESISVNSSVIKKRVPVEGGHKLRWTGNKTEQALLMFLERIGRDPLGTRARFDPANVHAYPFTSKKKRMTTCVKIQGAMRFFVKGASEMILQDCTQYHNGNTVERLADSHRKTIDDTINSFARNRLRTIGIAYSDVPGRELEPFTDKETEHPPLIFLGLLGIEDPIRAEVPIAVAKCKSAGVSVRMVTGDNKATAISIAKQAGIFGEVFSGPMKGERGLALEGKYFRELAKSERAMNAILPKLQVLARASPEDKQTLVLALKARGEVVAVTGDGTNDAIALKTADVGFAMNTGTDVAKNASDVVILDDNFASIVTAMKWGRNVNDNICKFIQFQTTVNVAAVFIAFMGAIMSGNGESPLKPVQLLWLNLIMDTMAALALATEPPSDTVLDRNPRGKKEPLITNRMWSNILGQAFYQIGVQLWILHHGFEWFECEEMSTEHLTIIFNVFVLMQVTNEFNARILTGHLNIFTGLASAHTFLFIIVVTLAVQYLGIHVFGVFMKTVPLSLEHWKKCTLISLVPLPLGLLLRMIPIPEPASDLHADYFLPTPDEDAADLDRPVPTLRKLVQQIITMLKVTGALQCKMTRKAS